MPIYDTLGVDSVEYILQQTCLKTCICGVSETKKLLDLKRRLPCLEYIILIGEITDQIKSMADDCNVTLLSFDSIRLELGGNQNHQPFALPHLVFQTAH